MDIMKNPKLFFREDMFESYDFTFDTSTKIDNKLVYVVNFKPKPHIEEPSFIGKLYIDAQSLALKSANFNLKLRNKRRSKQNFLLLKNQKEQMLLQYRQISSRL